MKIKLLITMALFAGGAMAQTSVPNGNFENWDTRTFEDPKYYRSSNTEVLRDGLPFNCVKTTDAYHGAYALKLTTEGGGSNMRFGYVVNGNTEDNPASWHGGIPISEKPDGIRGYFKCEIGDGDTGLIVLAFSKNGSNIGTYVFKIADSLSSYSLFDFKLQPALSQVPDSFIFAATSSDALREFALAGSMLQLDSLSLTGISSQPALFNGSFEEWDAIDVETPVSWYTQDSRDLPDLKSEDPYKGEYAVKLRTRQRDNNGSPRADAEMLSTGYFRNNCSNCGQQGGYPFSRNIDTLVFWYKYFPTAGGKASVWFNLKKNGSEIGGNGMELTASSSYQYAWLPINSMQTPDTIIINIQSGRWEDSALSHVGSELIIDEIQLKSSPLQTGLRFVNSPGAFRFMPNPAAEYVQMDMNSETPVAVSICDVQGRMLKHLPRVSGNVRLDIADLPEGIYIIRWTDAMGRAGSEQLSVCR